MRKYATKDIRNVGFVGHGGCGKTALSAAILLDTKAATRIDPAIFDSEPEEAERGSSVSSSLARVSWDKKRLTLIDTPGDSNFIADSLNCMTVMDTAVVVVSAVGHVEVQTERVWGFAEERGLPRLIFINMLDRDRASFSDCMSSIQEILTSDAKITSLQIPIGEEKSFKGVVDLISNTAITFADDGSGKFEVGDVPADMADDVEEARSSLIDDIVESDEELMEKYLEEEELTPDEVFGALSTGVAQGALIPVLCGAASANIGMQPLLDVLAKACPSPADRPPIKAKLDVDEVEVEAKEDGTLAAQVFKTIHDQFSGKITLFRLWSGSLSPDSGFYNVSQNVKERFGQLLFRQGKEQEAAGDVGPGDIVAVAKLKETGTGDSLGDDKEPLLLPPLPEVNPVVGYAVKPKTKAGEDKIGTALTKLVEADPTLRIERDAEASQALTGRPGMRAVAAIEADRQVLRDLPPVAEAALALLTDTDAIESYLPEELT